MNTYVIWVSVAVVSILGIAGIMAVLGFIRRIRTYVDVGKMIVFRLPTAISAVGSPIPYTLAGIREFRTNRRNCIVNFWNAIWRTGYIAVYGLLVLKMPKRVQGGTINLLDRAVQRLQTQ